MVSVETDDLKAENTVAWCNFVFSKTKITLQEIATCVEFELPVPFLAACSN